MQFLAPALVREGRWRTVLIFESTTRVRSPPSPPRISAEDRRALRLRDSVPLLAAFGDWLTEQGRRYPEHGELSIDNNLAERMLRAQALGRRNWTFLGSDRGGRTAAVLYSSTGTCKHHDIDPFAYLADILRRLPSHPAQQLDGLLPDAWFRSHPSALRKKAA